MEIRKLKAKNFACFEEIDLNLSKQGLVWIGGENRDTKSATNNGSGKSTLLRALCYGLYGDTIDGEKTGKIVRRGQRKVEVEIELKDKKDVWLIKRSRTAKSNFKLELILPDGNPSQESKQAIQKRIEDLIGMDFFAFRNTVLYGQNDIVRFADPRTTDQQRKSMLFKILRTEIFQDCHEIVKKEKKRVEEEINRAGRELREYEIRIEEKNVSRVQNDADDFERQRAVDLHEHKGLIENYKRLAKKELLLASKDDDVEIDVESILKRKKKIEFLIEGCNKAEVELRKKQEEKAELDADIEEMKEALATIKESKKTVGKRLENLQGNYCPLCESDLTKGYSKEVVDELKKEFESLFKQQKAQDKGLSLSLEERKILRDDIKGLTSQVMMRTDYLSKAEELRDELAEQEKKVERAEQLKEYHVVRAQDLLEMAKVQKESYKKTKQLVNPFLKRIDEIEVEIAELELDKREVESFVEQKANELAHYRFWVHGFSNQGLPSFFLDSVMPFITNRANKYLQVLSDGDITMNFSTQKTLKKTDDVRDKINIQWTVEGLPDSYPPSGGQMKKMSIATDLALMDLVSAREGDNLNLLALDEVLDGLDEEGCSRVVSLLTDLRKTKDTILVISHEPSMLDSFEKSLHIVKEDGVSRLI